MRKRISTSNTWLSVTSLMLSIAACSGPPKGTIPGLRETSSVSINLYDRANSKVLCRCGIEDRPTIEAILDCLTPHEPSDTAAGLMHSGPVIGKLGFQGPNGTTWVEFVDPGKNALCFTIGETAHIRTRPDLRSYRSDHRRLYGIDSEWVDEGQLFYEKLMQICLKAQQ